MTLDRFHADLGMADAEVGPDAAAHIETEAYGFLLAGGRLAWSEWVVLSRATREAFQRAGERLRREEASLVAVLLQNPTAAPVVAGEATEAEAVAQAACDAMIRAGEGVVGA